MDLKINWDHRRCRHTLERMWLRGISQEDVKIALIQGQKSRQKESQLLESLYSFYSIVYDEQIYPKINLRKVYPVTVKLW